MVRLQAPRALALLATALLCACIVDLPERPLDGGTTFDGARSDGALQPGCGNGRVDPNELCDIAITSGEGACPTSCKDGFACTKDELVGAGTCRAYCPFDAVTSCQSGDGCCPQGCNSDGDSDCSATCHDGKVDPLETCDTAIQPAQPGACPQSDADCKDSDACTQDTVLNPGSCTAECIHKKIIACGASDGCCPNGCTSANDKDCTPACGDGVLDAGEACDTAIPSGAKGACPKDANACADGDSCTTDSVTGSGCQQRCIHSAITTCKAGDSCCPATCDAQKDSDCAAVCGNNVVEAGEKCDGNCPMSCNSAPLCRTGKLLGSACQRECDYSGSVANGMACPSGTCQSGACCSGCAKLGNCYGGTSLASCGLGGVACSVCSATTSCETPSCATGACSVVPKSNGTSCPGGTCLGGDCCTGCVGGGLCKPGTTTKDCGSGGVTCALCPPAPVCQTATCTSTGCTLTPSPDGIACNGGAGTCRGGTCCEGCWLAGTCYPGTTDALCGADGGLCQACADCCSKGGVCGFCS